MSLVYRLLMAALDLTGIVFNLRMLRSCFKDKIKYTFLQKCRAVAVCQCACQVTILVADAVESWKGLQTQPREYCDVFRVLSSSTLFFQGCNLIAILIIFFDQPKLHGASELCYKLKISAALCLGFTGSLIWWYSCFAQEFLFQMVLRVVFVVIVAFVVFLFAYNARHNIHDKLEDETQQASMKTCSLLWKVFKEHRIPLLFITLLLACFLVILSWSFRSVENESQKDVLYLVITRFVDGVVLPVTFTDLIELSKQEENGLKTVIST